MNGWKCPDCGQAIFGNDWNTHEAAIIAHEEGHYDDDRGATPAKKTAAADTTTSAPTKEHDVTTPDSTAAKLKPIHPAPFGTDDGDSPTHTTDPTMREHMGDTSGLEVGDLKIERYLTMETQCPDWRLDPEAAPSMVTTISDIRCGDEVTILSDHPDELHTIARFLTEAAGELEKAMINVADERHVYESDLTDMEAYPFTVSWVSDGGEWGVVNEETGQTIVHSLPSPGAAIDAAHAIAVLVGGDATA